jgi:branched-chain amino acid transport system ATP-binding protein
VPTLAEDDALIIKGLHVSFTGAQAVSDVSLDVRPGEVVALLGANGAGKTTTLRAVSGLHRPDAGRVHYRGRDITGRPAHEVSRAGIAHVPEGRRLFSRMTVRENLEVGLYRRWPVRGGDLDRAFDLFPELTPLQGHSAYSLSGGEQQMVTIARALLPDPDIVMLDEPSLGLAPVIVDRIIDTVLRLKDEGKGILLVEQDTSVALLCSDRGYVLANGSVVFSGTRDELKASERVTEAYIGR